MSALRITAVTLGLALIFCLWLVFGDRAGRAARDAVRLGTTIERGK